MKKRSKVPKQRVLLQVINLPVTWLINHFSLSTVFFDNKNNEILKQKIRQGLLMGTEEHSDYYCINEDYNWI